jgi:hypothetical protein
MLMTNEKVTLHIELLSAATFGRGDGVAGLVDREIEHDQDGFPFLRGRTLKGLLNEAAEDLVFALGQQADALGWRRCKEHLFGQPGSGLTGHGTLYAADAQLPVNVRALLRDAIKAETLKPAEVFAGLTAIRRQTAMNEYGAPETATLRSMRVVLRGTFFEAELSFREAPTDDEWALLAGAALGLRAAGTGRNRGRGRLQVTLQKAWLDETQNAVWLREQWERLTKEEHHARPKL